MVRYLLPVIVLLLFGVIVSCEYTESEGRYFLPEGDPEAGRVAFQELQCSACHKVQGDDTMPEPVADKPGPVLDASVAMKPPGDIATSIIAPSHMIKDNDPQFMAGPTSIMGDYSNVMRVRQWIDLISYVKALDVPRSAAGPID